MSFKSRTQWDKKSAYAHLYWALRGGHTKTANTQAGKILQGLLLPTIAGFVASPHGYTPEGTAMGGLVGAVGLLAGKRLPLPLLTSTVAASIASRAGAPFLYRALSYNTDQQSIPATYDMGLLGQTGE